MPPLHHMVDEQQVGTPFPPDMHDARHLWLKAGLLFVWVMVTFGACWFVRDLTWNIGDWNFGYWMVAQGAVLMFILIVFVYCAAMNYFERQDQQIQQPQQSQSHSTDAPQPVGNER